MLVALIVLGAWLVKRAWGSKRKILKWIGVSLAGSVTLVLTLVLVMALVGFYKLSLPPSHSVATVKVVSTSEQIARGKYLAQLLCAGCHSLNNDLPLSGGKNLADDVGLPLGNLYGANLTPAGDLKDWSDGEILRALRWGMHKSGRQLAMPVKPTSQLSDADAQAIVAYLRSQPAVENKVPATSPSLLFGILVGAYGALDGAWPATFDVALPTITIMVATNPNNMVKPIRRTIAFLPGCFSNAAPPAGRSPVV